MDGAVACMKYVIFTVNFLIWCLGGALMGVGVWVKSDSDFWEYHDNLELPQYYQASYLVITAGVLIMIVGFFGCCGAAFDSPSMLLLYFIAMTLILILELTAGGLVWKVANGDELQKMLTDDIKDKIKSIRYDTKAERFVDLMQLHLECCGGFDMHDFRGQDTPPSCSSLRTNNVYIHGCGENLRRYLERKAGMVGGITLGLALLQIISLIFTMCLFCTIRPEKEKDDD